MHICFVSQEYPPETGWGGIGAYTFDLANGLVNLGHRVSVVSLSIGDREEYGVIDGVNVYRIFPKPDWARWPGLWRINHFWPGFAWAARKKVKELHQLNPIDIVEAPENRADSYLIKPFCRQPRYVVRLHTASRFVDQINKIEPNFRWRLTYRQEAWVLRHADLITAPSQAVVDLTQKFYRLPSRIKLVSNPIDTKTFHPVSGRKRKELLFVGRLEEHKGFRTLCTIIPNLLAQFPDLFVRIAGQDKLDSSGESWKSKLLGMIGSGHRSRVFIGPVLRSNLPKLYSRAAVVVVPSLWESFSYVVVESMACGTPVVASSVGGIQDIIEDQVTGYLVPADNVQMFEKRISSILCDISISYEMGRKARDEVKKNYAIDVVAPRVLDIYQDVAYDKR